MLGTTDSLSEPMTRKRQGNDTSKALKEKPISLEFYTQHKYFQRQNTYQTYER